MHGCNAVIHAAAKVDSWGSWGDFFKTTVEGTQNVVAAAQMAAVPRLIHISSEAVLADGPE